MMMKRFKASVLVKQRAVLSYMLVIAMFFTIIPTFNITASAVSYTATYTGSQGNLTLTSGTYLISDATITGATGKNGITIADAANVTIYISGTVTVKAGGPAAQGDGGKAGIYVPSGATLKVLKADGAAAAKLNSTGGNGGKAFVCGAGGGGAGIGTNGGNGGAQGSGYGANGGNGQSGAVPGTIGIAKEITLSVKGGSGGAYHDGFGGTNGWLGVENGKDNIRAGNGGTGGGAAGSYAANLGTGGAGGGAGGNGGQGGYQNDYNNWSECGGGGGGGGGVPAETFYLRGYGNAIITPSGCGGGFGGAAVVAKGGSNVGQGSKGTSYDVNAYSRTITEAKGTLRTVWAWSGNTGVTGNGGYGGNTKNDDHPGSDGGNGGKSGAVPVDYTSVEVEDMFGSVKYYTVISGSTMDFSQSPSFTFCHMFQGWYHGDTRVYNDTVVNGDQYNVTAKYTINHTDSFTTTWAKDCSTCTQKLVCTQCKETFTEKVNSTSKIKQALTCTQDEITEYTATFTNIEFNSAHKTATTTLTTKNAAGHKYNSYGVCTVCGDIKSDFITPNSKGYVEIDSVDKLKWFAAYVNSGKTVANAILMADLSLDNTFSRIGTSEYPYCGIFDGNGHTLTVNYNVTTEAVGGLIDYVGNATLRNINMNGTITTSKKYVGGAIGYMVANMIGKLTLEKVMSRVNIVSTLSDDNTHGGIIGVSQSPVSMTSCGYIGTITSANGINCGGLDGWTNGAATFTNCYMAGKMALSGDSGSATFCRGNAGNITLTNCYYLTAYGTAQGTQKTADEFSGGVVTYLLNSGKTNGTQDWYQTVGAGLPALSGDTVYYGYENCGATEKTYENTVTTDEIPAHTYGDWKDNGDGTHSRICTVCNDKQTADHTDANTDYTCDDCGASLGEPEVVSVDIEWGAMEFTYVDASEGTWNAKTHAYENATVGEWTCDTDANKITVTNNSNVSLLTTFEYAQAENYTAVKGIFIDKNSAEISSVKLERGDKTPQTAAAYLSLSGKPDTAIKDSVIGTVTVVVGEYIDESGDGVG